MKTVEIYMGTSDSLAWCAILVHGDKYKMLHGVRNDASTNMVVELTGLLEGLRALKEPCQVNIYSRNVTLVNCGSGAWKRKKYTDLWNEVLTEINKHQVAWIRTLESQGLPYDHYASNMAVKARKEYLEKHEKVEAKPIGVYQDELF